MSASVVVEAPPGDLTPAELQAAARDAYRQAAVDGRRPTGAELGRWFGRSERWGRDRIAECRAAADGNGPAAEPSPVSDGRGAPAPPDTNGASDGEQAAAVRTSGRDDGNEAAAFAVPSGPVGSRPVSPETMWSRRVIRWVTTAAVLVVAACAARSSYEHQRTVVEMAGNHEAAWYLPLSVDGMMLIASLNMLVRRWDGQPAGGLTWTALLLGGAASLAANIAAAPPTWIGRLVAAWSPLCLIVSYELLMQQLPDRTPAADGEGRQR